MIETIKGKYRYICNNLDSPIITNTFETDNNLTEQLLTQRNNNFEYKKFMQVKDLELSIKKINVLSFLLINNMIFLYCYILEN